MSARWAPSAAAPAAASVVREAARVARSQSSAPRAGPPARRSAMGDTRARRGLREAARRRRRVQPRDEGRPAPRWPRPRGAPWCPPAPRARRGRGAPTRAGGCAAPWRHRARRPRAHGRARRHTRAGSRKRRRPAAPSWNSRSICGVSQTALAWTASSAWLRGACPSRRNTRRSGGPFVVGPSGGDPVPMSTGSAAPAKRPATAQVPVAPSPRRASSAMRAPRMPRPGTRSEIASSRLVLPLPFGPVSTAMPAQGCQTSCR